MDRSYNGFAKRPPPAHSNNNSNKKPRGNGGNNNNNNNDNSVHRKKICSICKEFKSLMTEFSKTQRNKRSKAKCLSCCNNQGYHQPQPPNNNNNNNASSSTTITKPKQQQQLLLPRCSVCKNPKKSHQLFNGNNNRSSGNNNNNNNNNEEAANKAVSNNNNNSNNNNDKDMLIICNDCEYKRQRNAPRQCSKCGNIKEKLYYSEHQWKMGNSPLRPCLECLPLDKEKTFIQNENWQQAQNVFLPLIKKYGILFYEFPNWNDLESKFSMSPPTADDNNNDCSFLEGCYDILFHYGYCGWDLLSERTTRGRLTLQRKTVSIRNDDNDEYHNDWNDNVEDDNNVNVAVDNNNDDTTTRLAMVGRIEFDKSLPEAEALCFNSDYTITEMMIQQDNNNNTKNADSPPWKRTFSIGGYAINTVELINPDVREMPVEMYILQERMACPWRPVEHGNNVQELQDEFGTDNLVKFDSIQQADALMEQYKNRSSINDSNSWLYNHLQLPPDLVKRILCFAQSKPCPVLFFEPNDLIIKTIWSNEFREPAVSYIVARRRLSSS